MLQLVRLLQAEFEAAALSTDSGGLDKQARLAAAQGGTEVQPPRPLLRRLRHRCHNPEGSWDGKSKGKDKDKGKEASNACYNFAEGKGCKYGDFCKFKHDRLATRRMKRCLACGHEGHFRPECPLVPPELRQVKGFEGGQTAPPKVLGPRMLASLEGSSGRLGLCLRVCQVCQPCLVVSAELAS